MNVYNIAIDNTCEHVLKYFWWEVLKYAYDTKRNGGLLKKNGFVEVSQSGFHLKLINHETGCRTVVPIHGKDLKRGLEKAILKQAGLSKWSLPYNDDRSDKIWHYQGS